MNYLKIRSETNRVTSSFSLKSNSERISYLADEEKKTKLSIVSHINGELSLHNEVLFSNRCYSKHSNCLFYGRSNMFKLSDKARIIFAIIGASFILVNMYLIPLIKTENKFWEILLFILGVLLIVISLLSPPKIKFWK